MGIHGLTEYVHHKFGARRKAFPPGSKVVVDGNGFAHFISRTSNFSVFGGEYEDIARKAVVWSQRFETAGIAIRFVFDGLPDMGKMETTLQRMRASAEMADGLAKDLSNKSLRFADLESHHVTPTHLIHVVADALSMANFDVEFAKGEADGFIAALCPDIIVSGDSDFLIYPSVKHVTFFSDIAVLGGGGWINRSDKVSRNCCGVVGHFKDICPCLL